MTTGEARPFKNVFACLVHESRACIVDLVRNLRALDPASSIILYDGGKDAGLLDPVAGDADLSELHQPDLFIHPHPRPMTWGFLHGFAIDCLELALQVSPFDTLTIVDSDQVCIRPGYTAAIARYLAERPDVGMLGTTASDEPMSMPPSPAMTAFRETALWRSFLKRFRDPYAFPQWTFWPSTVFTRAVAEPLVRLFRDDQDLAAILAASRIWATEEILLPSFVAALGFKIARNPCVYDFVRFRARYSAADIDEAFARRDVYWVHPVPRRIDDPIREHIHRRVELERAGGSPICAALQPASDATGEPAIWSYWEGPMPPYVALCLETLRARHPGAVLLDRQSFDDLSRDDRDLPDLLSALSQLSPAHRSDFVRAYVLRRYGGLYLDPDCVVLADLGGVLERAEEHEFVGYRDPRGYVSNNFMATHAGGAVIEDLYRQVVASLRVGPPQEWLALSSVPLSAAVARQPRRHALLPTRAVSPLDWQDSPALAVERDDAGHQRTFAREALCYMLSNNTIRSRPQTAALAEMPASALRAGRSFLSFLLRSALAPAGSGRRRPAMVDPET